MLKRYFISVRNIPWTVSNSEFEKYFSKFGNIKHAKLIFNKEGLSTGCGFVEYYNKSIIKNVLRETHILEEEKLDIVDSAKYIEEEDLVHIGYRYIPYKYIQQDNFINEKYMQQKNYQFTNIENCFYKKKNTAEVITKIEKLLQKKR